MKKFTAIFMYVWVLTLVLPVWLVMTASLFIASVAWFILSFDWVFFDFMSESDLPLNPLAFFLDAEKGFRRSIKEAFREK